MNGTPHVEAAGCRDPGDPFEQFNRAQGMGTIRDPYPILAEMRRQGPVNRVDVRRRIVPERKLPPGAPEILYLLLTHDAVWNALRDGTSYSSSFYADTMGPVLGRTILEMDEPEHARHRGLLQKAFTRRALVRWQGELIAPVIHRLVDRFEARGRADLVRELTFPFPVAVISGMLGIPEADQPSFHRLAIELISISVDWERGRAASRALEEIYARVLAERRREPRDDLLSVLATAELDGSRLGDDEIFGFARLLAPAGAETTYRSSSNLLFGLLSHPQQLDAVRADPALVPQAIDEGLRWECPLLSIMRTATRDIEIDGYVVPKGAVAQLNLGAANRDPARYERPDAFDVFREHKQNLAFAFGAHRCLGQHLATCETTTLLGILFERLPNLRLDPEADDVHITGMTFRAPLALPVVWDPR